MAREEYSVRFGQQQLLVEHPVGSGVFSAPCGITGLTRSVTTNTNDVALPPCDDPEAIIWLGVDAVSKRMTLTFQGTLADNALPMWDAWSMGKDQRLVRWYRNIGEPNQGYWEGLAMLTEYSEESADRGRYTNSGTIIFDGEPEWVSIPPAPGITSPVTLPGTQPEVGAAFVAITGVYIGSGIEKEYDWFANGVKIPGAETISYTPVEADEGKILMVVETAKNISGTINTSASALFPVAPETP